MDDQGKETETATAGASSTSAATPHQSPPKNNLSSPVTPSDPVELKTESDKTPGGRTIDGKMIDDEDPVIDIIIHNIMCVFSVACHLDLQNIALTGNNVVLQRRNRMVTMKLRKPPTTALIWSSGKVTCSRATSESQARVAARRIARCIEKLGYNVKFKNFRIVNVLGTCTMPFAIKITPFSLRFRTAASYKPERHPGVIYKIDHPKATLMIFSTGSITVVAPSTNNIQRAIEHIYPLVREFGRVRTEQEMTHFRRKQARQHLAMICFEKNGDSHSSSFQYSYDSWERR